MFTIEEVRAQAALQRALERNVSAALQEQRLAQRVLQEKIEEKERAYAAHRSTVGQSVRTAQEEELSGLRRQGEHYLSRIRSAGAQVAQSLPRTLWEELRQESRGQAMDPLPDHLDTCVAGLRQIAAEVGETRDDLAAVPGGVLSRMDAAQRAALVHFLGQIRRAQKIEGIFHELCERWKADEEQKLSRALEVAGNSARIRMQGEKKRERIDERAQQALLQAFDWYQKSPSRLSGAQLQRAQARARDLGRVLPCAQVHWPGQVPDLCAVISLRELAAEPPLLKALRELYPGLWDERQEIVFPSACALSSQRGLVLLRGCGEQQWTAVLEELILGNVLRIPAGRYHFRICACAGEVPLSQPLRQLIRSFPEISGGRIVQGGRESERTILSLQAQMDRLLRGPLRGGEDFLQVNRGRGGEQIPCRTLVLCGYPQGLPGAAVRALERLSRLGPRCGIQVIVQAEEEQKGQLPGVGALPAFTLSRDGRLVGCADGGSYRMPRESLSSYPGDLFADFARALREVE